MCLIFHSLKPKNKMSQNYPLVQFKSFANYPEAAQWAKSLQIGKTRMVRLKIADYNAICSFITRNYAEFRIETIDAEDYLYKITRKELGQILAESPKRKGIAKDGFFITTYKNKEV